MRVDGQAAALYRLVEARQGRPRGGADRASASEVDRGAAGQGRPPVTDRVDLSEGVTAKMLQDALLTGVGKEIDEVLKGAGVDIREAAGMDWSAEATSDRIVSMATSFYDLYAEQHPEMTEEERIDGFQSLIVGAVDRGAGEAMRILEDAGFGDQTRDLAEETMSLVHEKLDAFFAGLRDRLEEEPARAGA